MLMKANAMAWLCDNRRLEEFLMSTEVDCAECKELCHVDELLAKVERRIREQVCEK